MNRYSANNYYGINLRYPVDRDLFSAWHLFLQLGPELNIVNRVINCIPLSDSVPERTINANLGEFDEKNGELTVPFNGSLFAKESSYGEKLISNKTLRS